MDIFGVITLMIIIMILLDNKNFFVWIITETEWEGIIGALILFEMFKFLIFFVVSGLATEMYHNTYYATLIFEKEAWIIESLLICMTILSIIYSKIRYN